MHVPNPSNIRRQVRKARSKATTPEGADKFFKAYQDKHPGTKLAPKDFFEEGAKKQKKERRIRKPKNLNQFAKKLNQSFDGTRTKLQKMENALKLADSGRKSLSDAIEIAGSLSPYTGSGEGALKRTVKSISLVSESAGALAQDLHDMLVKNDFIGDVAGQLHEAEKMIIAEATGKIPLVGGLLGDTAAWLTYKTRKLALGGALAALSVGGRLAINVPSSVAKMLYKGGKAIAETAVVKKKRKQAGPQQDHVTLSKALLGYSMSMDASDLELFQAANDKGIKDPKAFNKFMEKEALNDMIKHSKKGKSAANKATTPEGAKKLYEAYKEKHPATEQDVGHFFEKGDAQDKKKESPEISPKQRVQKLTSEMASANKVGKKGRGLAAKAENVQKFTADSVKAVGDLLVSVGTLSPYMKQDKAAKRDTLRRIGSVTKAGEKLGRNLFQFVDTGPKDLMEQVDRVHKTLPGILKWALKYGGKGAKIAVPVVPMALWCTIKGMKLAAGVALGAVAVQGRMMQIPPELAASIRGKKAASKENAVSKHLLQDVMSVDKADVEILVAAAEMPGGLNAANARKAVDQLVKKDLAEADKPQKKSSLQGRTIRLAYANVPLRKHLLPLLK